MQVHCRRVSQSQLHNSFRIQVQAPVKEGSMGLGAVFDRLAGVSPSVHRTAGHGTGCGRCTETCKGFALKQ